MTTYGCLAVMRHNESHVPAHMHMAQPALINFEGHKAHPPRGVWKLFKKSGYSAKSPGR